MCCVDPFGLVWSNKLMYFEWLPQEEAPINVAREMIKMELSFPVETYELRRQTPLFTNSRSASEPLKYTHVQPILKAALEYIHVPQDDIDHYSYHSFRIFLATALFQAGASDAMIQALLRWQSTESLRVYARLTVTEYSTWGNKALTAEIQTEQARHLPTTDMDAFWAEEPWRDIEEEQE